MMEHPDELIDKALQALNQSTTPPELESRILQALAAVDQAPARTLRVSRRLRLPLKWMPRPLPAGAIAAAVSVLALAILAGAGRGPTQHATTTKLHLGRTNPACRSALTREVEPAPLSALQPIQPVIRHRGTKGETVLRSAAQGNTAAAYDQPAPPLPLTRQEQLLMQLARRQNSQVQALLDPAQQNRLLARNDEEFDRFFVPPPPNQEAEQPASPGGTQ